MNDEHPVEKDAAIDALRRLLWELPSEFGQDPDDDSQVRPEFRVIKQGNVRAVHQALRDLQQALGYEPTRVTPPGPTDDQEADA